MSKVEGQDVPSAYPHPQLFGVWGDSSGGSGVIGSTGNTGTTEAPVGGVFGDTKQHGGVGVVGRSQHVQGARASWVSAPAGSACRASATDPVPGCWALAAKARACKARAPKGPG